MQQILQRTVEEEDSELLYNTQFKMECMQNVIKLCLDDRFFNPKSEQFQAYHREYENSMSEHIKQKTIFANKYLSEFKGLHHSWSLDYDSNVLTVTLEG